MLLNALNGSINSRYTFHFIYLICPQGKYDPSKIFIIKYIHLEKVTSLIWVFGSVRGHITIENVYHSYPPTMFPCKIVNEFLEIHWNVIVHM